jgi:MoaA/NifB/PqqE/SkfB family radical SAM enzyme
MTFENVKKNLDINPFVYTEGILLETTNRCNYANCHHRCPIHSMKERKILPLKIIEKILKELGEHNYGGRIYPFCYSEPLIDPRFFKIMEMINKYVPKAKVWFYTNGFMVDENMLMDIADNCESVKRVIFSIYNYEDERYFHKMIKRLRNKVPFELRAYGRYPMNKKMNDKVEWYDNEPINIKRSCPAPYKYIYINSSGDITICCHDWKAMHTFGSILNKSLVDIIKSKEMIDTYVNLSNKKREQYFLCSRCHKRVSSKV